MVSRTLVLGVDQYSVSDSLLLHQYPPTANEIWTHTCNYRQFRLAFTKRWAHQLNQLRPSNQWWEHLESCAIPPRAWNTPTDHYMTLTSHKMKVCLPQRHVQISWLIICHLIRAHKVSGPSSIMKMWQPRCTSITIIRRCGMVKR